MHNKNGQLRRKEQPLGICQRLFSFIMAGLVSRGVRRMILGTPRDNEPEVFVEDVRNNKRVSFKELEDWTPVDNLGSSILLPEKKRRSSEKEVPLVDSDGNYDHKDHQVQGIKSSTNGRQEKKTYNMAPNERLVILEPERDDSDIYAPRLRPLFTVESNINEKSSEFIQRRKEAMRRNADP